MLKIIDHPDRECWGKEVKGGEGIYSTSYEMACKKCEQIYSYQDVRFRPRKCACGSADFLELPKGKSFERSK